VYSPSQTKVGDLENTNPKGAVLPDIVVILLFQYFSLGEGIKKWLHAVNKQSTGLVARARGQRGIEHLPQS